MIRHAARNLMRRQVSGIDTLAHDADDYESLLMVSAWEALKRWRSHKKKEDPSAEERYVVRAVHNRVRNYYRNRKAAKRASGSTLMLDTIGYTSASCEYHIDENWEHRLLVRQFLERLHADLPAEYATVLGEVALNGGKHDGSTRTLQRKTQRARAHLRAVSQSAPKRV